MNIGTRLREARESRGLTLHQVAKSTKVSITTLQHIESNQFDHLPEGIYLKGYLRAFAAEVGLNPDDVVNEYMGQHPAEAPIENLPVVREEIVETRHPFRDVILVLSVIALSISAYQKLPSLLSDLRQQPF